MSLEQLAEYALRADIAAKESAEEAKRAKDELKAALEADGKLNGATKAIGNVRLIVKPSRRFSEALALELLTPEEATRYSVLKLDSALVKRNVTPDTYELMQSGNGYSVELKPLEAG